MKMLANYICQHVNIRVAKYQFLHGAKPLNKILLQDTLLKQNNFGTRISQN